MLENRVVLHWIYINYNKWTYHWILGIICFNMLWSIFVLWKTISHWFLLMGKTMQNLNLAYRSLFKVNIPAALTFWAGVTHKVISKIKVHQIQVSYLLPLKTPLKYSRMAFRTNYWNKACLVSYGNTIYKKS